MPRAPHVLSGALTDVFQLRSVAGATPHTFQAVYTMLTMRRDLSKQQLQAMLALASKHVVAAHVDNPTAFSEQVASLREVDVIVQLFPAPFGFEPLLRSRVRWKRRGGAA